MSCESEQRGGERGDGLAPAGEAARKRAAVETYARHEAALRRTARRYSLCADDAEDALQRGLEILLRKAPSEDPRELIRWTQTVVKHEALASDVRAALVGCGHVSGLLMRQVWPLALMLCADRVPIVRMHFKVR